MNFKKGLDKIKGLASARTLTGKELVNYESMDSYTKELMTYYNGEINDASKYTDGLATSKTINSFPLSRATEGEVYRVPQTNKYVICVKNYSGSEISLPNANFEELSVWENRESLRNLFRFKGTQSCRSLGEVTGNVKKLLAECNQSGLAKLTVAYTQLTEASGVDGLKVLLNDTVVDTTNFRTATTESTPKTDIDITTSVLLSVKKGDRIYVMSVNNAVKDFRGWSNGIVYYG